MQKTSDRANWPPPDLPQIPTPQKPRGKRAWNLGKAGEGGRLATFAFTLPWRIALSKPGISQRKLRQYPSGTMCANGAKSIRMNVNCIV
jgi:hypothetical protein